ncbi:hypothetical protein ACE198_22420 [Neobacillus sp. KR4-4]|uniref:hypothetical protein n=1 Tax=Neobacillus sp. KR4-4 TaxID=3344872 RepID=UPI0035CB5AFB
MAINTSVTSLPPFLLWKDKLLTYDEVIQIREKYGFFQSAPIYAFKTMFNYFKKYGVETPTQAWMLYQSEVKQVDKDVYAFHRHYQNFFETYLIMLMAFSSIPIDRDIISEFYIFNPGPRVGITRFLMDDFYHQTKPNSFPKLDKLKNIENRRFILSLNTFYKINELTEEAIVKEFLNAVSMDTYRKTGVFKNKSRYAKKSFLEFIEKIYPELVKIGAMEHKDNIYEFLRSLIYPPKDDVNKLRNYLNKRIENLKGTEMKTVIQKFVESNIIKINGNEEIQKEYGHLQSIIHNWCNLSIVAMDDGVDKIADISAQHRDQWLYENNKIDGKRLLIYILPVLKFYNEIILGKNSPDYYDVSIFSTKWSPNIGKDVNHTPLQGAAFGQIISALAQKILETRKECLVEGELNQEKFGKNLHKWETQVLLYKFFIYRLIWIILLTGRRLIEIRQLKLARVKNSLSADDKYVYIRTAKGNDDKMEEFERGQKYENGTYEFDYIHLDVFNELIKVAGFIYKGTGIPKRDQYLFPSTARNYEVIHPASIRNNFMELQTEFDILHGSPVDFKNKLMYQSSPDWQKLLGKPLFTIHDLRHAYIHTIHANAHLPLVQVVMNIGHRNNKSIGAYTQILASVFQVFNTLEEQGHVGAAKELVSTFYNETKGIEVDNAYVVLINFLEYLHEEKKDTPLKEINPDPNQFTEKDSDCVTTISCGDTGMGCLRCNDFRAGKMTFMALLSVSTIFDKEFRNINGAIDQINKRKKEILKVKSKEHKLYEAFERDFTSLIDKFRGFIESRQITLLSKDTGFGLAEKEADEIISKIGKRARKLNLDDDIVKYIKQSRKAGMFSEIDFTLYRTAANREVFKAL